MSGWITFWAAFLVVGLAAFAVLSIVVSIRAWFDLRALFSISDED